MTKSAFFTLLFSFLAIDSFAMKCETVKHLNPHITKCVDKHAICYIHKVGRSISCVKNK